MNLFSHRKQQYKETLIDSINPAKNSQNKHHDLDNKNKLNKSESYNSIDFVKYKFENSLTQRESNPISNFKQQNRKKTNDNSVPKIQLNNLNLKLVKNTNRMFKKSMTLDLTKKTISWNIDVQLDIALQKYRQTITSNISLFKEKEKIDLINLLKTSVNDILKGNFDIGGLNFINRNSLINRYRKNTNDDLELNLRNSFIPKSHSYKIGARSIRFNNDIIDKKEEYHNQRFRKASLFLSPNKRQTSYINNNEEGKDSAINGTFIDFRNIIRQNQDKQLLREGKASVFINDNINVGFICQGGDNCPNLQGFNRITHENKRLKSEILNQDLMSKITYDNYSKNYNNYKRVMNKNRQLKFSNIKKEQILQDIQSTVKFNSSNIIKLSNAMIKDIRNCLDNPTDNIDFKDIKNASQGTILVDEISTNLEKYSQINLMAKNKTQNKTKLNYNNSMSKTQALELKKQFNSILAEHSSSSSEKFSVQNVNEKKALDNTNSLKNLNKVNYTKISKTRLNDVKGKQKNVFNLKTANIVKHKNKNYNESAIKLINNSILNDLSLADNKLPPMNKSTSQVQQKPQPIKLIKSSSNLSNHYKEEDNFNKNNMSDSNTLLFH